jgi:hypothetical protein
MLLQSSRLRWLPVLVLLQSSRLRWLPVLVLLLQSCFSSPSMLLVSFSSSR